jgi:cytosine/adenosine deaminase-related metal-dependent hydrolase
VHVVAVELNLSHQERMPNVLVTLKAVPIMHAMLRRDFATVRDAGGAGAEVLGLPDELGRIAPGAWADLLVVNGNPLRDVSCLLGQGEHIPLVMEDGKIQFDELQH